MRELLTCGIPALGGCAPGARIVGKFHTNEHWSAHAAEKCRGSAVHDPLRRPAWARAPAADLKPVASFSAANALAPSGYSETKVSDTQYQVRATGTEATPKARIEKIARARAAQIGVEQKLKYYKVASVRVRRRCAARSTSSTRAGRRRRAAGRRSLIDVVYAKEPVDPSYVGSAASFEALNGELDSEVIPPEAKAAAEQEARGRLRPGRPDAFAARQARNCAFLPSGGDEAIKPLRIVAPLV